ncbi:Cyclic di-GMP phosphodiesterase Gmr [Shewanella khirikhana]|uniref:Cyclic di-GMP phosphodiesterase Gmr n=2 Tax=Shewanella khirikhana TaxID=1965282 RepID=A0ABN5TW12_9GAMM|nr:EAL domain-containing protein [Shewanella khirikhana]AZQ11000.1 Cyclic di-GMP phosphodiesterase Gmr [Shewanella khirikhana]
MQLFLHKNLQQHMQKALAIICFSLCLFSNQAASHTNTTTEFSHATEAKLTINTTTYGVSDGLSQNTVTAIAEDDDGYIWLGTLSGLNRFNGKEFKNFYSSKESGLTSSFILSLYTEDGDLYIGTDKGLFFYDELFENFHETSIKNKPIWSINRVGDRLLIGTDNSLIEFNKHIEKVSEFTNNNFHYIKKIVEFNNHYFVRNQDGTVIKCSLNFNECSIFANNAISIEKASNSLLIDTKSTLVKIDEFGNAYEYEELKDAVSYSDNRVILQGNVLSVSNFILSPQHYGVIDESNHLLKPELFATKNKKIITDTNRGFISIDTESNIVKKLKGIDGNIWSINTYSNKTVISDDSPILKILDISLDELLRVDTTIGGFKTALLTENNELVVASEKGVYLYNLANLDHKPIVISSKPSYTLNYDEKNNVVVVGTQSFELLKIKLSDNYKTETVPLTLKSPIFQVAGVDGIYYLAHQDGLTEVGKDYQREIFQGEMVYSVYEHDSFIYFGTGNGVYQISKADNAISQTFKTEKPVYSLKIIDNSIYASSIGEIWIKSGNNTFKLSSKNGSQEEYNNQGIGYFNDGILFGGVNGVSVLQPQTLKKYLDYVSRNLETSLDDLLIFNSTVKIGSEFLEKAINHSNEVKVKYSDYPLTLEFSTPKVNDGSVEYFYRLQGLSDDWIPSKSNRHATYTNLSPGNYTFEVYAVDQLSQFTGPVKSLNLVVTPPWWMSREAKLAYALMVIVVSITIMKAILRRREVQRQIAISEERLKLSLWGSGDEMWDWDIETGKIYRSNIWGSLEFPKDGHRSGRGDEESNIHPQDQERVREALNRHFYGETDHFEAAYRVKGKDGHWVWILDRAKIVERDDSDNALRMTGTIKNINNFKQAEEQLKLFERAIENISEGMFILDNDFRFVEVNEACCDICMLDRDSFIGTVLHFACYPDVYSEQVRIILRQQGRWSAEVESKRGDNSTFLMELTVDAIYDEQGTLSHFVGVFSDISRRKMQEEELRKLTNNDLLTGLPNRSNLQVSLSNLVKKDTHHTLMVLDLDNFKKINDSLGHQIGDELLLMVSRRMSGALPAHTSLYRLGGDEFAILIDKEPDIGSSAAIAKGVVDAFVAPFELAGEKLVVGVSIGIVLYPEDEQNEQALLRKADIAMYHAKSAGGNRYQFYSESLNRNAMRQLEVENLIREGLRDDLFEVYYQPKIDLRSSRMAGMEALVRLVHPVHGLIPPSEFIPLAEETGLIVEIGDLVMRKACFAAQKWREQGIFDGRVAVNLSSRQFALPDLQQRIESILRLTQLPAGNLELEITEGTVIKQPEKAIKVMQQLAKMGVSLALDDFGTGYSSLSYLKRFPIHTLKIDKAFVDDIDKSDRDLKMVDSIITIAHNMGLTVVGEGVEVPSQLNILRALKCEEIQGYIYSKAVPEQEFAELLRQDLAEFLAQKYNQR